MHKHYYILRFAQLYLATGMRISKRTTVNMRHVDLAQWRLL